MTVAYDGTNFHGWQLQGDTRTVEYELNKALTTLLKMETAVTGASRTDAGVHALGNIAVFDCTSQIPAEKFAYALNTILPNDVKIQRSCEVDGEFHPRHCDCVKTYEYRIYSAAHPIPTKDRYALYTYLKLDIDKMREAGSYLIGEHDFKSFASVHTQASITVRKIYGLQVLTESDNIVIRVTGNGFLYNMVRIIAGTLLEVGSGKYEPSYVKEMLLETNRCVAGPTAPPQGLTLVKIEYEDGIL